MILHLFKICPIYVWEHTLSAHSHVIKALRIGAGKRSTIRIPATEIKTLIGDTDPDTTES